MFVLKLTVYALYINDKAYSLLIIVFHYYPSHISDQAISFRFFEAHIGVVIAWTADNDST